MQATIYKYAPWRFIAAVVLLPLPILLLPHLLFPETAKAHMGKFLVLTTVLTVILLVYIYTITSKPIKLLTLQIANGEFALKEGEKVILSEFESSVNLLLAKHNHPESSVPPKLLFKFVKPNNKLLLRVYVEDQVWYFPAFMHNTRSEFHGSDNWGRYVTNKGGAQKILKHYGLENQMAFK